MTLSLVRKELNRFLAEADAEVLAEQIAEISGFDRIEDFGAARFDGKHAILEVRPDYIQDVQQAIARQKLGSISLDARILHRGETE